MFSQISAYIVGWVGKIAKVDKLIPEELLAVLRKSGEALASKLNAKSKHAQLKILQQCDELLRVFAKGRQAIKEFFTKLADDIGEWLVRNQKSFKLVEKADDIIIPFIRVLKQNTWYLKSLKLVEGPITNGRHGRQLGKWLALESEAMVKLYTSFWYETLNEALNKGKKLNKELKAMKEVLDNALLKLPSYNQNGKALLRSVFHTEEEITQMFKAGKEWTSKGFFSTTHSEQSLLAWMSKKPHHNVIFKVYAKNGKLIEKAAYLPQECEVLFKSNTTYFVESVQKIKHPMLSRGSNGEKVFEIILKEK